MEPNPPKRTTESFFQEIFDRDLSLDEIAEYKDRVVGFFDLLIEIDQRNRRKSNATENI